MDDFEEEDDIIMDMIKGQYYLVATSDAVNLAKLIDKEIPDYNSNYDVYGFSFSDLERFFDKFVEYDVVAVFMQFELMDDIVKKKATNRLFKFKPIKGVDCKGILIPRPCVAGEDRPKRTCNIDEIDVSMLNSKMDAFNNGEISFDDFLRSL